MNKSGICQKIVDYWQVDLRDLMVIFDDLSLPPAQIRLKPKEALADIVEFKYNRFIRTNEHDSESELEQP